MKQQIIKTAKDYLIARKLKVRIVEGNKDLQKGLAQASPIDDAKKNEILDFWKPYLFNKYAKKSFDVRWFDIYNRTNVFGFDLKYYIPDGYYYRIVDAFFSNIEKAPVLDDKNLYDLFFHDVPQPRTICRKINDVYLDADYHLISREKAINSCLNEGTVIIKSSVESSAGSGVMKWELGKSPEDELRKSLTGSRCTVVQESVKQHKILADFNDSCVNTLRLVTLIFEGEVHVVSSVVIMGGKGAKTNHLHSGGIVCGILPSGQLRDTGFDGKLNMYNTHPNGISFADVTIPNYDRCVALVKDMSPRLSSATKIIGWDFTIGEDGQPILIEANLYFSGSVQIAAGPVLGELTPRVLDYIKQQSL